ncbi:MAG: hypothetical protein Q8936_16385 [Bacillota bacterium]|nr:hypothetical protein [Bacillota bacterium]
MKKYYLLIAALVVSLLFGTYTFLGQRQQKRYADEKFVECIGQVASCFAVDYSKVNDDIKNYNLSKAASNLQAARDILPLTSYAKVQSKEPNTANAISDLYLCMTVERTTNSTNRQIAVTEKEEAIFRCLENIKMNPSNKGNWDALSKITDGISY